MILLTAEARREAREANPEMYRALMEQYKRATLEIARKMPRDCQRRKVYAAERLVGRGYSLASVEAARELVQQITSSRWWKNQVARSNYLDQSLDYDYPQEVKVLGKRGRTSTGNSMTSTIRLSLSKGLYEMVVLHELAHVVTPARYLGHGREFCRNYLKIVRHVRGQEMARSLRAAFRAEHVRWITRPNAKGNPQIVEHQEAARYINEARQRAIQHTREMAEREGITGVNLAVNFRERPLYLHPAERKRLKKILET